MPRFVYSLFAHVGGPREAKQSNRWDIRPGNRRKHTDHTSALHPSSCKIIWAKELFHIVTDGLNYKYEHYWRLLRHERKWMDFAASLNAKAKAKAKAVEDVEMDFPGAVGGKSGGTTPDTRPLRRDAAKKRRSNDGMSSTASAFIEVMQTMSESKRQQQETEATWAGDYRTCEFQKIALEELKREDAQRARENEIMCMELNSMNLTAWQRRYWEGEQRRIVLRQEREHGPPEEDTPSMNAD
ncbi:hypothetical protein BS78_10G135000 [Paspalum vaginatum]|nr:hypothetical protein BS78_10G135000 [Paspalum vaginatum]